MEPLKINMAEDGERMYTINVATVMSVSCLAKNAREANDILQTWIDKTLTTDGYVVDAFSKYMIVRDVKAVHQIRNPSHWEADRVCLELLDDIDDLLFNDEMALVYKEPVEKTEELPVVEENEAEAINISEKEEEEN